MRRRSPAYRAEAALPPTEAARWTAQTVLLVILTAAWTGAVLYVPAFLGTAGDPTSATLRVVLASAVPVVLLVGAIHAFGRMRLERLARDPGPLLVLPFQDHADGSGPGSATGERLRAAFQRHLLATRLHGATAIPSPGRTTEFIHVIEKAADAAPGVASLFMRLVRWISPVSCYEVECTMLGDGAAPGPTGRPCRLLVELTRAPRSSLTPETFVADDWDTAVARAAEWTAAMVLPRSRICRRPPWTLWQGQAVPVELFSAYLRFQRHRDARRLDEAMEAIHEAVQLDPGNLGLRLEKGKLEEQLGLPLDALATYGWIVGQAARRDRRLAYLWFGPPPVDPPATPGSSRSWHFHPRGVPGLDPWHPVVYVARYRYCLLLGHGWELAERWWPDVTAEQQRRTAQCRAARCRSARSTATDDARRMLSTRLVDRHADLASRLRGGRIRDRTRPLLTDIAEFLGDGGAPVRDAGRLRHDTAIFLTSLGVWETEHLLAERPEIRFSPATLRALRSVLPHRALQLILPRAILLKALCLHRVHPGDPELVRGAAASMVFPLDEPVLEPDLNDLLADGWPARVAVLERWIDKIMKPGRRHLGSWHEHYNVACVLAILLDGGHPRAQADHLAGAAVTELEKAVARGYGGTVSAESDWILNEDPDLDALRRRTEFEEFERMHLGLAEGRLLRGFGPVEWQRHATLDHLVHAFATHNATERQRSSSSSLTAAARLDVEERNWALVRALARDYGDWHARLTFARHVREVLAPCGAHREPVFSAEVLAAQVGAVAPLLVGRRASGWGVRDPQSVQDAIEQVVASSRDRLDGLHALFDERDPFPTDAPELWGALAALFDDVTPAPPDWKGHRSTVHARLATFSERVADVVGRRRRSAG